MTVVGTVITDPIARRVGEQDFTRFRVASNVFAALAAVALVYALVFRPIDTPPKTYAAPERAERAEHVRSVDPADALNLSAYEIGTAIRMQDGWLYAAAKLPKAGVLMRMQPDGSGMNEVLDVAGGEITDLAFAPDGTLWMTTIEADGGKLCRVSNDQWGVTVEPVVTQIDGKALSCPAAVAVGTATGPAAISDRRTRGTKTRIPGKVPSRAAIVECILAPGRATDPPAVSPGGPCSADSSC